MVGRRVVVVGVIVALLAVSGFLVFQTLQTQGCQSPSSASPSKYQAGKLEFGAVTEYCLADPQRWPNAIATSPDGSVWFGEEAVPGVGQLFPNGTVVEHAFPGVNGTVGQITGYKSGIWGIAVWRGMVWAGDEAGNSIVGYSPVNGTFRVLAIPHRYYEPYSLAPGPDGALWFTGLLQNGSLGRVAPDLSLSIYPVLQNKTQIPVDVQFVNASLGYYVALDPFSGMKSGLYAFDPGNVSGGITPRQVRGGLSLMYANSLSVSPPGIWVAQHLASNIAGYDLNSRGWTVYPTSTLSFTNTALPYYVRSSGSTVWFSEHYANRIGALNPGAGTLTEFSEADPPVSDKKDIQNDLTIAASSAGLWFTSTTGNYIGFIDGSHAPGFSLGVSGANSLSISPGKSAPVQLHVTGTWTTGLRVQVSDSENFTSVPSFLSVQPDKTLVPAGSGPVPLTVALSASASIQPGRYTVGVTVTDGLVYQTAYLFVTVG